MVSKTAKDMIIETCVKENIFSYFCSIPSKIHLHTNQHESQKESCKGLNSFKTQDLYGFFFGRKTVSGMYTVAVMIIN